jgi:PAS domain S-box-containing protein
MGVYGASNAAWPGDPFDVTSTAVAVVDAEGLIVHWSRGAQDLLGHPAREVLLRPAAALLADGDPADVTAWLRGLDRGGEGVITVRHRAGHMVRLAVRVCPLSSPAGARSWLVVAGDAADRRRHALFQAAARGLLEQSPIGVAVLDTRLRYRWVNRALTGMEEPAPPPPGPRTTPPPPGPRKTRPSPGPRRTRPPFAPRRTTPPHRPRRTGRPPGPPRRTRPPSRTPSRREPGGRW